jgi:ABC-2 type transport system ATP-binding protein
MPFAIEITDLHKQYPGALEPALSGLSLTAARGQITGLLGPNGAGKSTTINILCGLVAPDRGKATIFGKDCVHETQELRKQIGVVPQQIALFGNLTAMENLIYIGRLYGLSKADVCERAASLLDRLDMSRHANKRVNRYSGGMKRRTNIIASLLHQPALLILDEPTAGVDVQSRALILEFLEEYREQGNTVLYTSHLMDEAQKLCDEVVIVDNGKFIVNGTPQALIAETPDCDVLEDVFLHYTGHTVRD